MTVSISIEPLAQFLTELKPMLHRHYDEVDDYLKENNTPLDPDYDAYLSLNDQGVVHCVVARDDRARIAGYILYIVAPHNHYTGVVFGICDMIYVSPYHRKTGVALDMIRFAEHNIQCTYMTICEKVKHEFPALVKAVGYTPLETTYIRKVDNHG